MKKYWNEWKWLPMLLAGCAIFGIGFNLFLAPHSINAGGLSGLAQVFVHWTGLGSVGLVTALMNVPLFIAGGRRIGTRFFIGSFVGMIAMSVFIDLFAGVPVPETEPFIGSLYGGVFSGVSMGLIFMSGMSSGGSDIIVRLIKLRNRNFSVGSISLAFDTLVAILTGIAFGDFTKTLYAGITLYITSKIIDAVLYSFDYSKVAWIISPEYERISREINDQLGRGVTLLDGSGYYRREPTKIVLSAIKRQQVAELKDLVAAIDPDAFIILQEAHQVLGDGFIRYSKDAL